MAKRILALGLAGDPLVLLDNIEGPFASPALASLLTARTISERILGLSKTATVPAQAVWVATGNNLSFRGDLGRRAVPIDLDAGVERPEDRHDFKHPGQRLLDYIRAARPGLVIAGLTILRAYHLAGRPSAPTAERSCIGMGSFEGWDDLTRGALLWAGCADPVAGRQRIRDESDVDHEELSRFLAVWRATFHSQAMSVAEAVRIANEGASELKEVLTSIDPEGAGTDTGRIGYRLRQWKGRIAGGLRFETVGGKGHSARKWHATQLPAAGHEGHHGHGHGPVGSMPRGEGD